MGYKDLSCTSWCPRKLSNQTVSNACCFYIQQEKVIKVFNTVNFTEGKKKSTMKYLCENSVNASKEKKDMTHECFVFMPKYKNKLKHSFYFH